MMTPEIQKQLDDLNRRIKELESENAELKHQIETAQQKADEAGESDLFEGIFN